MAKFFDYILQGSDATEENAIDAARGLDWQEIEAEEADYPHLQYVDTVNGVGIWYNYGSDNYYFTDEVEEERSPIQNINALGDLGNFGLNESENMKVRKITKKELSNLIKEGAIRLHRRALLENRIKQINEELDMINGVWKDIPGFNGNYQVSTKGKFRELSDRFIGFPFIKIKPKKGYIKLTNPSDGLEKVYSSKELFNKVFQ